MSIFLSQSPGIGGLDELTPAEEVFLTSLAGLPYSQGDILYHDGSFLANLGIGSPGEGLVVNSAGTIPEWSTSVTETVIGEPVGGGTSGSVLFVDSSNTLAQNNDNFFYDETNKRLGLGTKTPNEQLEITGNFRLPTTTSTTGIIKKGTTPFIHSYHNTDNNDNNLFVGLNTGNFTMHDAVNVWGASANTGIGTETLKSLTTGFYNTAIGYQSGNGITSGGSNVLLGYQTGEHINTGSDNFGLGRDTLQDLTNGAKNVAIGTRALRELIGSAGNVSIGHQSGYVTTGNYNIYLGYEAGKQATGSDKLYISNTDTLTPLIYGDFTSTGGLIFHSQGTGATPVTVKGVAGQSSNLQEWQNSAGTVLSVVDKDGNVGIGTTTPVDKLDVAGKIAIDGVSRVYYPDQTDFLGTMYLGNGDGGAKLSHTTGSEGQANTFIGIGSGNANTTGNSNTANGYASLYSNTTGNYNTANGMYSLRSNTTGTSNTANGYASLYLNTTGNYNTANGYLSLRSNTTGYNNTANGYASLYELTEGIQNTAYGYNTGRGITTGDYNTIIGANVIGLDADLSNNIIIADGEGNRRINVDSVGNVGIGTDSPEAKLAVDLNEWGTDLDILDLRNTCTAGDANLSYSIKMGRTYEDRFFDIKYSTTNYGIHGAKTKLLFNRGDTDANLMSILGSGNIGIGTTSPFAKLSVKGAGTTTGINFQTTDSADSPLVTVLDSGNVGIGTDSPMSKLHINHTGDNTYPLTLGDVNTLDSDTGIYFRTTGVAFVNSLNNGELHLGTGGAGNPDSGIRIDSSGNVGIGTTSPDAKLHIDTGSTTEEGLIVRGVASQSANLQEWQNSTGTNLSYIDSLGRITIGTSNSYNSSIAISNTTTSASYIMALDFRPTLTTSGANLYGIYVLPTMTIPGGKLATGGEFGATAVTVSSGTGTYRAMYLNQPNTVTGTLALATGLHVANIDKGSTNYAIYTNDGTVHFGDNVGIGVTTPTALLHLAAGTATNPQLKLEPSVLLTTPETGSIEFADNRFYITTDGNQRAIDRTSDVALSTVTVENTTTETTIWTGEMGADSIFVGNILKFQADGIISSNSSTDLITIRVKVGGNTMATLTSAAKKLEDDHWHLKANATQRTIGATGSRAIHLDLTVDEVVTELITVGTIDTTSNMDITITAQWNAANAGNIISLLQGFMEYKN